VAAGARRGGFTGAYRIGVWLAIGSILMLFVALTSAYIVPQPPPMIGVRSRYESVWLSTALILISSVTIELRGVF